MRARLSETTLEYTLSGEGEPLVWCHGLASCREGDQDVIDEFSNHFTVLSYDARGHGSSEPVRDASMFTYQALARDLGELLDHVGWSQAILTGASMGAATAARLTCISPERTRALVMARPGSGGQAASERLQLLFRFGAEAIRSGGLDAAIEFLLTIPEAAEAIEQDPGRIDGLRRDWGRHDPFSIAAALEGIPASPPVTPDIDPSRFGGPVLVIPGNDPIHPAAAGAACAALFSNATLLEPFDGLPRNLETEHFVATVRTFLVNAL